MLSLSRQIYPELLVLRNQPGLFTLTYVDGDCMLLSYDTLIEFPKTLLPPYTIGTVFKNGTNLFWNLVRHSGGKERDGIYKRSLEDLSRALEKNSYWDRCGRLRIEDIRKCLEDAGKLVKVISPMTNTASRHSILVMDGVNVKLDSVFSDYTSPYAKFVEYVTKAYETSKGEKCPEWFMEKYCPETSD